jgi:hypothetical protein
VFEKLRCFLSSKRKVVHDFIIISSLFLDVSKKFTTFSKIIDFAATTANLPRAWAKSPSSQRNQLFWNM